MVRASELRVRDVVSLNDGSRLGQIDDIEMDLESGRITAIVIPMRRPFGLFSRHHDYVIPWGWIKKIGTDVILVEPPSGTDLRQYRLPPAPD